MAVNPGSYLKTWEAKSTLLPSPATGSCLTRLHIQHCYLFHDQQWASFVLCKLGFLGHILRFPEEEPVRGRDFYVESHGKRKPDRPRTSYITYIQRVLEYHEADISPDDIALLFFFSLSVALVLPPLVYFFFAHLYIKVKTHGNSTRN